MPVYMIYTDSEQELDGSFDSSVASFGNSIRAGRAVWLVSSENDAGQIWNILKTFLRDNNDKLIVSAVQRDTKWSGFDRSTSDWMMHELKEARRIAKKEKKAAKAAKAG